MDSAGERFEAIRTALADRSNVLTVKELCQLAGVSRSGYYNWMSSQRARELREERDRAAFEQILEAYRFRGYAKGVRGIHMRLLHMGIRMNVKKIRRLMRKYNLSCPIRKPNPYRRLRKSIRMGTTAEELVHREFESRGPRAVLLNYWLMINDYPPMIIYEEDRRAYYDALQAYDEQENLDLLTEFFEEQTVKTWTRSMELSDSDAPKRKSLGFFML